MARSAMYRWVELLVTSPSGKRQWMCRYCGRISTAPDKECPGYLWFGSEAAEKRMGRRCSGIDEFGTDADTDVSVVTYDPTGENPPWRKGKVSLLPEHAGEDLREVRSH